MKKLLKSIIVVAAVVALVLVAHRVFRRSEPQQMLMGGGEVAVVTAVVELRSFAQRIEATGTVSANESVSITPATSGHVIAIHFDNGTTVEAGDVLVELEHSEESASLDGARAELHKQERQFDRAKALFEQNLISEEELEEVTTTLDAAQAGVDAAEARLRNHVITAPFAGVVGIRRVSPGTLVSPGETVATLDDLSTVKVDFTVSESMLSYVETGQEITARSVSWPGVEFRGAVTGVDTRVDEATRALWVRACIRNPEARLRTGTSLAVELESDPRLSVGVPEAAIQVSGDAQYVYVVREDKSVERRDLKLGVRDVGWVEVSAGLEPGETIVVDGLLNLRDGVRVREAGADGATEFAPDGTPPDAERPHP